jgi:hypothetical protein
MIGRSSLVGLRVMGWGSEGWISMGHNDDDEILMLDLVFEANL